MAADVDLPAALLYPATIPGRQLLTVPQDPVQAGLCAPVSRGGPSGAGVLVMRLPAGLRRPLVSGRFNPLSQRHCDTCGEFDGLLLAQPDLGGQRHHGAVPRLRLAGEFGGVQRLQLLTPSPLRHCLAVDPSEDHAAISLVRPRRHTAAGGAGAPRGRHSRAARGVGDWAGQGFGAGGVLRRVGSQPGPG